MDGIWIDVAGPPMLDRLVELHAAYVAEDVRRGDAPADTGVDAPADDVARAAIEPLLHDRALGMILVAGEGRRVFGYAVLTWGWGLESGGREALLDEMYVAAERRGHGVGGRLVDRALDAARGAGCRTLFLETEQTNDDARRLYARHGLSEQDSIWMSTEL